MPVTDAERSRPIPLDLATYIGQGGVFNGTIFMVGRFFALVLQHDRPGLQIRPTPGSDAEGALVPIWPTDVQVHWPPPLPVDVLGKLHRVTQHLQMLPPQVAPVGP